MGRPTRPHDDERVDRDDRYDDRSYERSGYDRGYDREYGEGGSRSGGGLYLGNGEVGSIWKRVGELYLEPGECGK